MSSSHADVPLDHPRHASLLLRSRIVEGVQKGITSFDGLIAHGRGEAYDYLLGERTHSFALNAIRTAGTMLRQAKHPVISVNGNVAALVPQELGELSEVLQCPLEVNLFHPSSDREMRIREHLIAYGATNVLLPEADCMIADLTSNRRFVHKEGIFSSDVVFVPLEDGDRCGALIQSGKKVITVDLNPLSRTARQATITIIDNVTRCLSLLIQGLRSQDSKKFDSQAMTEEYDHIETLREAEQVIRRSTI